MRVVSLAGVAYGNKRFVALGRRAFFISPDGISWEEGKSGLFLFPQDVTFAGGYFFVFDAGLHFSTNGKSWQSTSPGEGCLLTSIHFGRGRFIAVGSAGEIFVSGDLRQWEERRSNTPELLNGVTYGNKRFVIVGRNTILTSSDGRRWKCKTFMEGNGLKKIVWTGKYFIAFGYGPKIFFSPDAEEWRSQPLGDYLSRWSSLVSAGGRLLVGGEGGTMTCSLAFSSP